MDLESASKAVSVAVAVISGSYAAIQAGRSWMQQTRESRRQGNERRMKELRVLLAEREQCQMVLDQLFDYEGEFDVHLRVDNWDFTPEEATTRCRVDRAFEHLRLLHRTVDMRLIEPADLGPWVYWIHRIGTRPALARYSRACGYGAFMADLARWTEGSRELATLRNNCPWWPREQQDSDPAT